MSAPARTSLRDPFSPDGLVCSRSQSFTGLPPTPRPAWIAPSRSQATMFSMPKRCKVRMQAKPAAPAPATTSFIVSARLPVSLSALRLAASTTTAVPCWSS